MPSSVLKRFSNGVTIERDDPDAVEQAVLGLAARLSEMHPEIRRIIWFGSRVQGESRVGSDVDLCLILSEDDGRWFDRIPRYQPDNFPTDLDIFPYSEREIGLLEKNRPSFHASIMSGRELYRREARRDE